MTVALVGYTGSGTGDDPFRPDVPDALEVNAGWSAIDLRPDCTVVDGLAVVSAPALFSGATIIADDPRDLSRLSNQIRSRFANRLGLSVDADTLPDMLLEILLLHGDDANPSRWNQLRPAGNRLEVWLGYLIKDMWLPSGGATLATDTFDRADSTNIGDWWTEFDGSVQVQSNTLRGDGTGSDCRARWEERLTETDDGWAEVIAETNTDGGSRVGACARYQSGADTCYVFHWGGNGGKDHRMSKVVTGTLTAVGALTADSETDGVVVKCVVRGSTQKGYLDTVLASGASHTDVSITTGRRAGVLVNANGVTRAMAHSWLMGDWTYTAICNHLLDEGSTGGGPYVTSSINFVKGRLYYLAVGTHRSPTVPAPTVAGTTTGDTWTQIQTTNVAPSATIRRLTLYAYIPTSDHTETVTMTFSNTQTHGVWIVDEFDNVNTVSLALAHGNNTNTGKGNSGVASASLGAFKANHGTYIVTLTIQNAAISAEASDGWLKMGEQQQNDGGNLLTIASAFTSDLADTTPSMTFTSTEWGCIASEITVKIDEERRRSRTRHPMMQLVTQ